MSKLLSGFDTGICTILPESCYPLEGIITIKDENDNTVKYVHIGRFYICFEPKARFINKLFFIRVKK